jgi:spermidine synthase
VKTVEKIPLWKKWLSYLFDVRIESAASDLNPELHVLLCAGKLQLCTANAIYSYEDRYDNFRLLFKKINMISPKRASVLVLGLGMGSVPLLLEKTGMKIAHMTFVELDETVIYFAEKYQLHKLNIPYTVFCADAEGFVTQCTESYDLIISDVFVDDVIPMNLTEVPYLQKVKELLLEDGRLIYNCLASTKKDKQLSQAIFESAFVKVFPKSKLHHVWQNYMLVGDK